MAWPVYMSLRPVIAAELSLSVTIGVTTEVLTLAAGRYYNDSILASESFAQALANALNTHSAVGGDPFVVTYDLAAGEFTMSRAGVFDVTWPDTVLRDWLGWQGPVAGAAAYTSEQVAQGTIFADTGRATWPGRQYNWKVGETTAQAGVVAQIGTGFEVVTSVWEHQLEPGAFGASPLASGARDDDSSVVPWTWLDFFRHHRRYYVRTPFRFYALSTDGINDWEDEYLLVNADMFGPKRGEAEVDAYWTIHLEVADYVVST